MQLRIASHRSRLAWLVGSALAVASLAGMTGCDLQENADLDQGQQLFTQKCGTCHTLTAAGTNAEVGPNLDDAFAGARASGMDQDTIEGVVESQIENPRPANPDQTEVYMPAEPGRGRGRNRRGRVRRQRRGRAGDSSRRSSSPRSSSPPTAAAATR